MTTTHKRFLVAFVLLFSMLACSILPSGLLPQPVSTDPAITTEPATQTTVFPTQLSPGQAAVTQAVTAVAPTQAPAILPTQAAPSPQAVEQTPGAERIKFAPGSFSGASLGALPQGGVNQYVLGASGGQVLTVMLLVHSGEPGLAVWGADGTVLISDHAGATQWSGTLPTTQDYFIGVNNQGTGQAAYTIQIIIPPLNSPEPQPPVQPPSPAAGRIQFAPGSASTTVFGRTPAAGTSHYVLKALAGQTLAVELGLVKGQAILIIWGADGTVLISDHAGATQWSGAIPTTQDYFIDVRSTGQEATAYTMRVNIPPVGK